MDYDRLIDQLTPHPVDRLALRAVARAMADHPLLAGRAEAVVRELARPAVRPDGAPYTPEECLAYAADFMQAIGIPGSLAAPVLGFIGEVDMDSVPDEAIEDEGVVSHVEAAMREDGGPDRYFRSPEAQRQYGEALARLNAPQEAAQMPPRTRAYEREQADVDIAAYERMMRDEPGKYWGDADAQRNYRAAIERRLAADALPAAAAPEGGGDSPAGLPPD
jgi:hypothetical protein